VQLEPRFVSVQLETERNLFGNEPDWYCLNKRSVNYEGSMAQIPSLHRPQQFEKPRRTAFERHVIVAPVSRNRRISGGVGEKFMLALISVGPRIPDRRYPSFPISDVC
jgi:hypothetical protein